MIPSVDKQLTRVRELERRRADLLNQLERSLALQRIWPEAFAHGRVRVHLTGNPHRPADVRLVATNGAGGERRFPLSALPPVLLRYHADRVESPPVVFRRYVERLERRESER